MHRVWSPVAGLVPAAHVCAESSVERKESEDGRVEPGRARLRGSWVTFAIDEGMDHRVMPGDDNRFATGEGIERAVVDATKIAIFLFYFSY
jgi:hypothetical protein